MPESHAEWMWSFVMAIPVEYEDGTPEQVRQQAIIFGDSSCDPTTEMRHAALVHLLNWADDRDTHHQSQIGRPSRTVKRVLPESVRAVWAQRPPVQWEAIEAALQAADIQIWVNLVGPYVPETPDGDAAATHDG